MGYRKHCGLPPGSKCNSCVTASGFIGQARADPFYLRFRLLHLIQRAINDVIAGVSIAHHHFKALVSRKLLDGANIGTSLCKIGDGCVAQSMWNDLDWVEPQSLRYLRPKASRSWAAVMLVTYTGVP